MQNILWETVEKLRSKQIDVTQANAITTGIKEIVNVTRLEMQYAALTNPKMQLKKGDVPMLERK